jgi:hypothetical protein
MYTLGWVINRRGAELAPLEAARTYVAEETPAPEKT